jgi:hypothetical protein
LTGKQKGDPDDVLTDGVRGPTLLCNHLKRRSADSLESFSQRMYTTSYWGEPASPGLLAVLQPVQRKEIAVLEVTLKQFEKPDEVRVFDKGKFEVVHIGGMTIGRASYEPGWKWSQHVAPIAGAPRCVIEHVGMVVSGRAMAAFEDGTEIEMVPGHLFYIPPIPHDSWVIGDEPYVSLHFLGADNYTK